MADPTRRSREAGDLLYDAFHSAAIGGSLVALFFLAIDALNGRALFTPSLMGSVLFAGEAAETVSDIRLDMVAYYTAAHFAAFGAIGAAVSLLVYEVELHARHPVVALLVVFGVFEVAFILATAILMPGVVAVIGSVNVGIANLLAALGITGFLVLSHRPDLWQRLKHAAHLA